ncbi:MAG TPA: RNA polymerase-associated protein RapA, partial [Marinobacter sp.]|nr:RNA polymerase-associated protein RapA [Marinobacter sp.]
EEYRLVESLAGQAPGVLLLTATPEQVGVASHFARLRLLDPARFHDLEAFREEEAGYAEVNRVVQTLQSDNRLPEGKNLNTLRNWLGDHLDTLMARENPVEAVVDALLDRHGTGRVLFRNTRDTIRGFPERRVCPVPLELPDCYRSEDVQWGEPGLSPEQTVDEEQWL